MSWKDNVKNWDGGKLYKILQGSRSYHGGNFEWLLPKDGKPGDWTPIIENVKMCERGYHLTTHYAHWSGHNASIYEAEGDVVEFDGYDKVVCSRARLLRLVDNPFDECGYCNSGKFNSGSWNSGNYNFGSWNSGNYNSGFRNSGNCNSGNWNSGSYNSGSYNSGSYNFGNCNSGNWNSGNGNYGYFCTIYKSNKIFNELIPENWEPRFPKWIYFNLLSEGYKASWQKVFEDVSIEGVKELLELPNFNYEIFEEISSITRKQIEEKIRRRIMSWKNWDGKLYKVLQGNKSCYGGDFEWSLPKDGNPGDWTPIIDNVKMCKRGYHLTIHYAHWSNKEDISVYEAEGDVIEFDGYDKVVCSRVRLLRLIENPFPKNNIGKNNSGNYNTGDSNSGDRNSGDFNLGFGNSNDENSGDMNSGYKNSGYYNSGSCNIGDVNSGSYNSGNYNSGDGNSGNYNSGNWNSGNNNSGYFCRHKMPIIIFEKPAPKNWNPKFPNWMKPGLSESYYLAWQKAFEKANIEGIKELLELPNFDYEIFEEITSITKKQIEEKLGI